MPLTQIACLVEAPGARRPPLKLAFQHDTIEGLGATCGPGAERV